MSLIDTEVETHLSEFKTMDSKYFSFYFIFRDLELGLT